MGGDKLKVTMDGVYNGDKFFEANARRISKKYSINKFPTNFLLDSEGKIIKRDIPQEELEKFLEENLK